MHKSIHNFKNFLTRLSKAKAWTFWLAGRLVIVEHRKGNSYWIKFDRYAAAYHNAIHLRKYISKERDNAKRNSLEIIGLTNWKNWTPKCEGGVTCKTTKDVNAATLVKLEWKIQTNPENILNQVVKTKISQRGDFLTVKRLSNTSNILKYIMDHNYSLKLKHGGFRVMTSNHSYTSRIG